MKKEIHFWHIFYMLLAYIALIIYLKPPFVLGLLKLFIKYEEIESTSIKGIYFFFLNL